MSYILKAILVVAIAALTGCAATVNRPVAAEAKLTASTTAPKQLGLMVVGNSAMEGSADWQSFRGEWRAAMAAATATAGLRFTYFDTNVPEQTEPTTLIRVQVNDYRYLTPGVRYGFGIMTGNAFVDADVEFVELPLKKVLGSRKYTTTSSAWHGVFAAMTAKQLAAISTEIVKEVNQK